MQEVCIAMHFAKGFMKSGTAKTVAAVVVPTALLTQEYLPEGLLFSFNYRYTTLNRDWKRITRGYTFLCKKCDSAETMWVLLSSSSCLRYVIISRAGAGY